MSDELSVEMKVHKAVQYLERAMNLYDHAIAIGIVSVLLSTLSCVLIFTDLIKLWLTTICAQAITFVVVLALSKMSEHYDTKARSLMDDPDIAKLISRIKGGES